MSSSNGEQILLQVTLPYACFGVVLSGGQVVEAAPIAQWMIGKPFSFVVKWVERKGGWIRRLKNRVGSLERAMSAPPPVRIQWLSSAETLTQLLRQKNLMSHEGG